MVPFKRTMAVSYRLSICDAIALSLTIQLQLAVDVSDAQIKMGSLWSKI